MMADSGEVLACAATVMAETTRLSSLSKRRTHLETLDSPARTLSYIAVSSAALIGPSRAATGVPKACKAANTRAPSSALPHHVGLANSSGFPSGVDTIPTEIVRQSGADAMISE